MVIVILLGLILLNTIILKKSKQVILEPGNLFNAYWICNILLGLVVFNVSYRWNGFPLIYVLFISFLYARSCQVGSRIVVSTRKYDCEYSGQEHTIIIILILCAISGLLYSVLELANNGFSLSTVFSDLHSAGYYFTEGRYGSNDIKVSLIEQIFLTINYGGFVLGGYSVRKRLVKVRYTLINFVPMIISMITTTAKAVVICALLLWISGFLVGNAVSNDRLIIKRKTIISAIVVVVIAYLAFYLSFYIRYGSSSYTNINQRILVYAIGHIPCLDNWLSTQEVTLFGQSYGYLFLEVIMELLGVAAPKVNAYDFTIVTSYGWTNVPTAFADYLIDFGLLGNILFTFFIGLVCGAAYRSLQKNHGAFTHAIIGLTYYCILYSFLVSPLRYLSIVGGFIVFGFFIAFLQRTKMRI